MTYPGEGQIAVLPAEDAAAPVSSAPNIVTLPSGAVVTLHPKVTLPLGVAALAVAKSTSREVIADGSPFSAVESAVIEGGLAEIYLRFGVKSWTFRDPDGLPLPVTPDNIERLLPYNGGGREVAEAADALYSDEVFLPFRQAQEKLLALLRTAQQTSPPSPNGSTPPTRSPRSSRTGSAAGKRSAGRGRSPGKKRT